MFNNGFNAAAVTAQHHAALARAVRNQLPAGRLAERDDDDQEIRAEASEYFDTPIDTSVRRGRKGSGKSLRFY